jgi:glutaredoxin
VAWAESLGGINYPLLSDFWPHGAVAEKYGVLRSEDGKTERAIFIIDKEGIIQYIDIKDWIDDQPSNEVLFEELKRITPESFEAYQEVDEQAPEPLPKGGVVLYCTNWCPDCKRARFWLKKHDIEFTEVNIDRVPAAAAQVKVWADGNRTTPTFDIDGTIVVDWDEKRLKELLLKG